jgi:type IV pilus assembly protein PilQ
MFNLIATRRRRLLGGLAFALAAVGLHAQPAADRALESVDFVALEGQGVLITLTMSAPAPQPAVFSVDQPARLSIDLPDTRVAMSERYRKVNVGNVRAIAMAESQTRTRLVVELNNPARYDVQQVSNTLLIRIGGGTMASTSAGMATAATRVAAQVEGVDFRRGDNGEGRVLVRLSNPNIPVDTRNESGKIITRFRNASVPSALMRRMEVLDFATPVKFVDVRQTGNDTEIVVTIAGNKDYEQTAYQSGNQYTIELTPLTEAEREQRRLSQPQFTGERISLSFQSINVRSLLQIIADVAGTNMVISDSVTGDMAMRLENVPWDQALDIILRTKGLGMRQQGNVMLVAPADEIAQREKLELEALKQKVELAPLRSEIIQVNYAKATDIKALLSSADTSLLSERGRVSVDERTNTLLVLETREKIEEVRKLVTRLDVPVRQVLIESRIVIANDDFARELGTRFGTSTIGTAGNTTIGQSGNNTASNTVANGGVPTLDDSYIVNLPTASSPAGRMAWTILGADFLVDFELSALQQEGRGEVISTPRVVTANGKQATIEQGREIPYQTSSGNTGTQTQFKKAVLSLTVTPQITPDNRVVMDLSVSNDSQGENVTTGTGSAPAIDTRKVDTQVLIRSGETVVLGGVFQEESSESTAKVPLLGDIPLLGHLFRNSTRSKNKRELLIFVTPKVLQEGLSTS